MTWQEEFDYSAREVEKISSKIYATYCRENDKKEQKYLLNCREKLEKALKKLKEEKNTLEKKDEEKSSKKDVKHNWKILSLLKRIQSLVEENQGFLYNY